MIGRRRTAGSASSPARAGQGVSPRTCAARAAPAVSVLLPVYNDAGTIARAVRSIRAQTFPDWELLVLDDGSTDGSAERAESAGRADPRICCVRLSHRGLARTLNAGLEAARGRIVARMDADDVSLCVG